MKKNAILTALSVLLTMTVSATTVNYTADNTSIFSNPERGFTEELGGETMLTDSKNHVIKPETSSFFSSTRNAKESLLVAIYYLGNYKTKDLSDAILQGFDEDMQILREKGYKCILRFAYDWNSKNDAELSWVKRHIAQLKPHLASNADVIYVLQTGFVGQWGEWYYSSHFGNETQHLTDNRREVIDAMLDACPPDRFLLVRYPLIKGEYLGANNNPYTTALSPTEAFTGTTKARIGHHNDAFLNEWGNDGTYVSWDGEDKDDDPIVRQYIADETLYVPNGGETNVEDDDLATDVYTQAESEMSTYHWSFCGESYAPEVTNKWKSSGIFDNLNRNMGYRYQLTTATLPSQAAAGSSVNVKLNIKNVGYAPLYNERHAYIVLKKGTQTYSIQLASDPRRWLPNNVVTAIDENITIPSNVPAGTYQMYLHMPDKYASLASNPRYAVRFANTGVWDANTGMNNLNASIVISEGVTPPPTPSAFTIDGNFDDWADLTNLAHTEVPSDAANKGLYDMRWYADESDIFFYLEYAASTNTIDIMLSTDENSSTGNDYWQWTNAGAEFLIEGEPTDFTNATFSMFDNTYPQTEWNGWIETSVSNLLMASEVKTLSNGHNAIEGRISQANLGTISTLRVGTYTCENWNPTGRLPQGDGGAAVPMLEVPIQKATATLPVVTPVSSACKILHNGQLFIIRDGQIYTLQGQRLP